MPAILNLSQEKGYTHYFYGSTEHTLKRLRKVLLTRYPELKIVGMYAPPFRRLTREEDEVDVSRINESGADFVWVALGAPKQEKWMYEHRGRVGGLMIGVGAAFDFIAGTTKRAPMWMQKFCMEWIFRIMQDPRRMLPRYLNTNFSFVYHTCRESLKVRDKKDEKAGKWWRSSPCGWRPSGTWWMSTTGMGIMSPERNMMRNMDGRAENSIRVSEFTLYLPSETAV